MLHTTIHIYIELHAWEGGLSACKRLILGHKRYGKMNEIVLLAAIMMKRSWDFENAAEYFGGLEEEPVEGFTKAAMVFQAAHCYELQRQAEAQERQAAVEAGTLSEDDSSSDDEHSVSAFTFAWRIQYDEEKRKEGVVVTQVS